MSETLFLQLHTLLGTLQAKPVVEHEGHKRLHTSTDVIGDEEES